jgi:hypothetical protein
MEAATSLKAATMLGGNLMHLPYREQDRSESIVTVLGSAAA